MNTHHQQSGSPPPAVIPFQFESHEVRTLDRDGEPWFVGLDVCSVLEIEKPRNSLARLDEDEKEALTMGSLGGSQKTTVINESGLYSLILTSRKPAAKRFKRWVTHEVLPAIRKSGRYEVEKHSAEAFTGRCRELAANLAAEARQCIYDALIEGGTDALSLHRFVASFDYELRPQVRRLERKEMVFSLEKLAEILAGPEGYMASDLELANLARACSVTLARRIKHQTAMKALPPAKKRN